MLVVLLATASNAAVWVLHAADVSPELYEMCRQSGFLLAADSVALAKNWTPESGLEPPPWFDIDGNEIAYIGACPPAKQEVELKIPEPPGRPTVKRTSRIVE